MPLPNLVKWQVPNAWRRQPGPRVAEGLARSRRSRWSMAFAAKSGVKQPNLSNLSRCTGFIRDFLVSGSARLVTPQLTSLRGEDPEAWKAFLL